MERLKGKKLYIGLLVFFLLGIFLFVILKDKIFFPNNVASIEWLMKPKFHKASIFSSGVAWVQEKENGAWKLIDKAEKVVVDNFQANSISGYDKETGLAQFTNNENLKGFVNLSGDIVISPEYAYAGSFKYGMAYVTKKIDDKKSSGIIDHNGNIVMPMVYEDIYPISPNLFTVKKEGKWGVVNKKGEVVIDFLFLDVLWPISPGSFAAVAVREDIGFDKNKMVYTPGYQQVGLINDTGHWILPASYDQIYPEGEGLIGLEKDRKAGFMDLQGNLVIDFKFAGNALPQSARGAGNYFSEGLAVVDLGLDRLAPPFPPAEKYLNAVIDRTGKTVFEFYGYPVANFMRGLLLICRSEDPYKYEVRNRSGDSCALPSGIKILSITEDTESNGIILLVQMGEKGKYGYLKVTPK